MGDINNTVFVCVDCETTGLEAKRDRVIEVAAACFTMNEILESFETLIDPEVPIPESSTAIHHIIPDMIKGKPKVVDVLPNLVKLIGNHIVVGHGVKFDLEILTEAMVRHNFSGNLLKNPILDTLRMARLYGQSPVNSLEQLRRHFGIEACGAHRAMGDVMVNIEVFRRLAKDYKTTEAIFEALSHPILFKIMPLGKHRGRPLKEIPLEYLIWASRKDFDNDLLYSLRTEIKKRKKGNLFTQASNPFGDLL